MAEVPKDYLQWLTGTDLDEDLAYTVRHYLGRSTQEPEYVQVSEQQQDIRCPFCETWHILPKAGHSGGPKCYVRVWLDDRMECIFVDKNTFRLPIHGTVCRSRLQIIYLMANLIVAD